MNNAILNITNWFLGLVAWISSLMIIYSGIRYFLARGNKEKENRAGKMFIYGLIVLFIVCFLYAVLLPTAPPLAPI